MNEHELKQRAKDFALRIIKLVNVLPNTTIGRAIGNQLVRCGTLIVASQKSLNQKSPPEADPQPEAGTAPSAEKIKNQKSQRGFTIMEVMVVILIISLGLVGVLSLVTQNIKVKYINKNGLIASQLAQEGLELVRNLRDENWLTEGLNWKQNIVGDGTYIVDYSGRASVDDSVNSINGAGTNLKIDVDGFYGHDVGTATIFNRLISAVDYGDYLAVSSTVRWQDKGNFYNYTAEMVLYDWK